ncbi:hypothetical protein V8C40DRAFT_258912 [Trichoderma camerunense]
MGKNAMSGLIMGRFYLLLGVHVDTARVCRAFRVEHLVTQVYGVNITLPTTFLVNIKYGVKLPSPFLQEFASAYHMLVRCEIASHAALQLTSPTGLSIRPKR